MKYLKIFKNWRIIALTIMAIAAVILIAGDGNKTNLIVFAKIIGFFVATFCYKIGKDWYESGKIDEINVFNDNEDNE